MSPRKPVTFIVKRTVGLRRKTRNFYNEKVPSDSQRTYNESEKKRKELKMTGHFYSEKDRRT